MQREEKDVFRGPHNRFYFVGLKNPTYFPNQSQALIRTRTRQRKTLKSQVSFTSNTNEKIIAPNIFSDAQKLKRSQLPWIKDKNILKSINYLRNLNFDQNDVQYIQSLDIILPVLSGEEAINFIERNRINVKFDKLPSKNTHAQYDFENNCILINEIYKNTKNPAEILAISEAILHEIGHAKDKDEANSVQEEIECLALNALAHRTLSKNNQNIFAHSNSPIVSNGVCIYSDLFFNNEPSKSALINRLKQKYGYLPAGDFKHSPNKIALEVKSR